MADEPPRATCRSARLAAGRRADRRGDHRAARSTSWPASSTRSAAASAARRSSRRRWCWSSCSGTRAPGADGPRGGWPPRRWRRWRAAASTTSSAAASRATASTATGWCRTSRRCSTTTPCCSASTPAGATDVGRAGRPRRSPTSCSPSSAPPRAASRPRSTPTPRAPRARFYVWTPAAARPTCSVPDDGAVGGRAARGHRGRHLRARHLDAAAARGPGRPRAAGSTCERRLLDARDRRERPARDDKVVAAWNGLAISGLCSRPAPLIGLPAYVEAAVAAGDLLVDACTWSTAGCAGSRGTACVGTPAGVLEDYGCVASRLPRPAAGHRRRPVARAAPSSCSTWRSTRFRADDGGFYDTADDAEALVARPRDPSDNASPERAVVDRARARRPTPR